MTSSSPDPQTRASAAGIAAGASPWWIVILVAVSVFVATLALWWVLRTQERAHILRAFRLQAETAANEVRLQMMSRMQALLRMVRRWEVQNFAQQQQTDTALYIEDLQGLRAVVSLDAAGAIRWVTPPREHIRASRPPSNLAIRAGAPFSGDLADVAISPSFPLADGDCEFSAWLPVRQADDGLEGWIQALFSCSELFDSVLENFGSAYTLAILEGDLEIYRRADPTLESRRDLLSQAPALFLNAGWEVQVWPTNEALEDLQSALPEFMLGFGALISLLAVVGGYLALSIRKGRTDLSHQISQRLGAQKALRDSEEYFRLAVDAIVDYAIIALDAGGRVSTWNKGAERLLGYKKEEIIGQSVSIFYPRSDRGAGMPSGILEAAVRDGRAEDEGWRIRKDGTRFLASVVIRPFRDETGRHQGFAAVIYDLTEQKRAKGEVSLAYLALDSSDTGFVITDPESRIRYVNDAFLRLFGFSDRSEAVGRMAAQLPVSGVRSSTSMLELIESLAGKTIEIEVKGREGSVTPVMGFSSEYSDEAGTASGWIASLVDLTSVKHSERMVVQVRHLAERIFQTIREPLVTLDTGMRLVSANRSFYETYRTSEEECRGQSLRDLCDRQWDLPELRKLLEEIVPRKTVLTDFMVEHEIEGIGRRVMLLNASQLESDPLDIDLILLAIQDVTDRVRSEERLRATVQELDHSNQELRQFAYVASHDLQEPLRAVSGCVQILKKRYTGQLDEGAEELIRHAVEGASRMRGLIEALLDYSRVGTRGKPFEPTDCNAVIKAVLSNLQVMVAESEAEVTCGQLPRLAADQLQLVQLFQNLISNAIKFRAQATPKIQVGAERQDGFWRFWVRDNGIGIEPEYRQRIFTIFQRLHTRTEYEGTGIGLAICKKIVERHGGEIWAESQSGQGSTFCFTLPDRQPV